MSLQRSPHSITVVLPETEYGKRKKYRELANGPFSYVLLVISTQVGLRKRYKKSLEAFTQLMSVQVA